MMGTVVGGDSRREAAGQKAPWITARMLLLLSVTQPGQMVIVDPCGFATLVHTRCAFIVSGAASNNYPAEAGSR
jgi:hypothetical protein